MRTNSVEEWTGMRGTVRTPITTKTKQVADEDDRREKWDHNAEIASEVPDVKIKTSPCPAEL